MTTPAPYTEDEIRERFLDQVWILARYWAGLDGSNVPANSNPLDRITGFAHSLLAMIDGCSMDMPAFELRAYPHPDDKAFHIREGERWFPEGVDIAGGLHELLYADHLRRDM